MIKLMLPLRVQVSTDRKKYKKVKGKRVENTHYGKPNYFQCNLNDYRNAHFRTLSKAKKEYSMLVADAVDMWRWSLIADYRPGTVRDGWELGKPYWDTPVFNVANRELYLYMPTKRVVDVNNVCTIVDKFAADALTKLGLWLDDDYIHAPRSVFDWGGIDKDNPRVEYIITERTK